MAGLGPQRLQRAAATINQLELGRIHDDALIFARSRHDADRISQTMCACELHHLFNLIGCYLNDRTHLFGEQTRIGALRCYFQINVETAAAGKCHFQKRHQQPTI